MKDEMPVPPAMAHMQQMIKGCPPPLEIDDAGHFVQQLGTLVAQQTFAAFGLTADQSYRGMKILNLVLHPDLASSRVNLHLEAQA